MQVLSLGRDDPLEEGMAAHSSILAWRIPGQRSLGGYSPRGNIRLDTTEHVCIHTLIIETKAAFCSLPVYHVQGSGTVVASVLSGPVCSDS